MANYQCDSCEELRQNAPNFIINGLGDDEVDNLKGNNGLAGNSTNCVDVNDMNDCFVGMMDKEVNQYETCDWKEFMKRFIPNIWTVLKGIISWLCGVQCTVKTLANGLSLKISEDDDDASHIIAGKGISFLGTGSQSRESQVTFLYIAGGLVRVQGSLLFNRSSFTDAMACYNFDDDGDGTRKSASRSGNTVWNNTTGTIQPMVGGGELLYEIRISKEQYPEIKNIYAGIGGPTGGGMYQINLTPFSEGEWAYGQHGNCDSETGVGSGGHSDGHQVPPGWIYVQARMVNIGYLNADGDRYSPRGFMGIRLDLGDIECE